MISSANDPLLYVASELTLRSELCGDSGVRMDESVLDGCYDLHDPEDFESDSCNQKLQ